ncbi:MAG TPA: hypothetical protein VGJ33_00595 [Candidatus Angelobacter sp.]|jgi:hypothetical protein
MNKLREQTWFTEQWATEVRDATRDLVRLYYEALETVSAFPGFFLRVKLFGLRSGHRPLFVLKSFFREAAVEHIRTVLRQTDLLHLRAFAASRPLKLEMSLGVKKTAKAEVVAEAETRRSKFIEQQQRIATILQEAAQDVHGLAELLTNEERRGQRALKSVMRLLRRGLPFLWAGWVIAQFKHWSNAPQLQALLFFLGTALVYHLTALATLPFHDAGERAYILFEGFMGKTSDGLAPLFPEASRLEKAMFEKFGVHPPVVISWEMIIPIFHYMVVSGLIVWLWIKLPLGHTARELVGACGFLLIMTYLRELFVLTQLLGLRYRGRSRWEIFLALFTSFQSLVPLEEQHGESESEKPDEH